jgi:hypothetical protein
MRLALAVVLVLNTATYDHGWLHLIEAQRCSLCSGESRDIRGCLKISPYIYRGQFAALIYRIFFLLLPIMSLHTGIRATDVAAARVLRVLFLAAACEHGRSAGPGLPGRPTPHRAKGASVPATSGRLRQPPRACGRNCTGDRTGPGHMQKSHSRLSTGPVAGM